MRILHLFSDWKWTGPAEPALNLAEQLACRGHDVFFASASPPHPVEDSLPMRAEASLVQVLEGLALEKHFNVLNNVSDIRRLKSLIREKKIDVLHTHRDQDHLIGGAGAWLAGTGTIKVRTNHTARPFHVLSIRHRVLVHRLTDRLIEVSRETLRADRERFGLREETAVFVDAAVNLDRFRPGDVRPHREELGIRPGEIVVGIVARVQRHRRFETLFLAFRRALRVQPDLRLLVVGRGTHFEEVAREPIERLGIGDRVTLAGYRRDDYPGVLASFDMKVFLTPGTDGSCRAVREAMASGVPVIASRRGILPELVEEGAGILVEDTPEDLGEAILRLAGDEVLRRKLGRGARRVAESRFDPTAHADRVERVYEEALVCVKGRLPAHTTPGVSTRPADAGRDGRCDVSVVIVNWNGRHLLSDCLKSVFESHGGLSIEAVLVDNGSTDGSVEYLRENWPGVRLIANESNRGFGAANNQVFREARGDRILLLNTDARLYGSTLKNLSDFLDAHPESGAVTPNLVDEHGRPQNAFDNFPTLATELLNKGLLRTLFPARFPSKRQDFTEPFEVESALGACLLLRREALEKAGNFDEGFFFFLEETDLCFRIREAGFGIHLQPNATATHLGGASKAQAPAEAWIEYYRSLYRYFRKHETPWALRALRIGRFVKLVLNTFGTFLLLFFSMGMHRRSLRKFPVYVRLLLWHLALCPDDQGLRPPKSQV